VSIGLSWNRNYIPLAVWENGRDILVIVGIMNDDVVDLLAKDRTERAVMADRPVERRAADMIDTERRLP